MDRRQRKTRAAIFAAFTALLSRKSYEKITVQEIIDAADVGRTTFYAHFETKEHLLKALCVELFGHIVKSAVDGTHTHADYAQDGAPGSVFCHLLAHLKENDRGAVTLLSCQSSEIFLRYFKESLTQLVRAQFAGQNRRNNLDIPEDFLVNHIAGSFVEMTLWWIRGGMRLTPEELNRYFAAVTLPVV